jgi:hypothetical protein
VELAVAEGSLLNGTSYKEKMLRRRRRGEKMTSFVI